jgi:hypothetical protein
MPDVNIDHIEALVGPLPKGRALDSPSSGLQWYDEGERDFDFLNHLIGELRAALAEAYAVIERLAEENKKAVYGCCEECRYAEELQARAEQAEADLAACSEKLRVSNAICIAEKRRTEQAENRLMLAEGARDSWQERAEHAEATANALGEEKAREKQRRIQAEAGLRHE